MSEPAVQTENGSSAPALSNEVAIVIQEMNEVVGELARCPLEVESLLQSPEQRKSLPNVRAQPQYLVCFDVLDVGKDEYLELHGEVAKAGVQIARIAAIRTAIRAHLAAGL